MYEASNQSSTGTDEHRGPGRPRSIGRITYQPKPCIRCGTLITWKQRKNNCCSKRCSNTVTSSGAKRKSAKVCGICKGPFIAKPAERYCSDTCKLRADISWREGTRQTFMRLLILCRRRGGALTVDDLLAIHKRQEGLCALSGMRMTTALTRGRVWTNVSVDRVDSSRGYDVNNVQLVCLAANLMKNNLPQEDFVRWCRVIADKHALEPVEHWDR